MYDLLKQHVELCWSDTNSTKLKAFHLYQKIFEFCEM